MNKIFINNKPIRLTPGRLDLIINALNSYYQSNQDALDKNDYGLLKDGNDKLTNAGRQYADEKEKAKVLALMFEEVRG